MTRRPAIEHETLADLLCLDAVEVKCHDCGRRHQAPPNRLFERLQTCDWATPLHDAQKKLRCSCGARQAQIVIPRARPAQQALRLVEKPEKPWQRFDRHIKAYR